MTADQALKQCQDLLTAGQKIRDQPVVDHKTDDGKFDPADLPSLGKLVESGKLFVEISANLPDEAKSSQADMHTLMKETKELADAITPAEVVSQFAAWLREQWTANALASKNFHELQVMLPLLKLRGQEFGPAHSFCKQLTCSHIVAESRSLTFDLSWLMFCCKLVSVQKCRVQTDLLAGMLGLPVSFCIATFCIPSLQDRSTPLSC